MTFAAYGLTSADAVGLSGELEELLSRKLPETLLYEHPTVRQLVAALVEGPAVAAAVDDDAPIPAHSARAELGITGMACRFPGGANTPDLFWRNLLAGVDASCEVPADRWDAHRYFDPDPYRPGTAYTTRGGFIDDIAGFDAAFFGISPREALRMDPQQRLLLEITWAALEDAGLAADGLGESRTGVFVGMMAGNQYASVLTDRAGDGELDDPYLGLGTAPSVMAGRISYLLDLRGPSLVVDTACSSSLVALHLAVNSIREGECDRAVVAGVGATLHPDTVRQACKMRMLAADGRCKTFDAEADGFLLGEGCGAVVIERVADARARRHRPLAILRGSAVNQDGTSNGLTAPNRAAQVAVIREAHRRAGVAATEVGYVEAHGSGTQLGDAIEIGALTEIFGDPQRLLEPMPVGAVKTNIGHLTGAAGMAGLIKTVLALRHGVIPRNLHLRQPNPAIDWAAGVIRLPNHTVPWPRRDAATRTAGVSSFGWSGTNAHVVLSAAEPEPAASQDDTPDHRHVLPLSARTPDALAAYARTMSAYLREHDELEPVAVATTLQSGRNAMEYRACVPFRTVAEAAAALDGVGEPTPITYSPRGHVARVHFALPGTGDQFPGMGRGLYESEPGFREALDRCAELARPLLGMDLRTALFADAAPATPDPFAALRGESSSEPTELTTRTDLAHASVFALNYAAAQLWLDYGIEPDALLGYSLGEYSAACLAGVLELEAAVPLVVRRARLIADAEPSGMLTVATSAQRVGEYLGPELSLAIVNSDTTVVVAGPDAPLRELERRLGDDGIVSRRVATARAVHAESLRPLRERLIALFDDVELRAPRLRFLSNVTGTWITAEQATDPSYWAEHLCSTVLFADNARTLAEADRCVLLDLGAGQLASLALQAVSRPDRITALPTLGGGVSRDPDDLVVARTIGRLWSAGGAVDWTRAGAGGDSLSLPTYPFEHRRFWPDETPHRPVRTGPQVLEPHWALEPASDIEAGRGPYLLIADPATPGGALATRLAGTLDDAEVVIVSPGTEFATADHGGYRLRTDSADDYTRLFAALAKRDLLPHTVVHLLSVTGQQSEGADTVHAHVRRGFDSLVALARPLAQQRAEGCRILVVTDHAQLVDADDILHPGKATLTGPALTIGQEYPGLAVRTVDLGALDPAAVRAELGWPANSSTIAHRGRRRSVQRLRPLAPEDSGTPYVRDDGVYLITGGTGRIGLRIAAHLAAAASGVRLVLLARSPISVVGDDPRIAAIRAMEADGAHVTVTRCDIGDYAATARTIAEIRTRFGRIDGVVHAAGVLSPDAFATLEALSADTVTGHFRAKVDGTLALAAALRGDEPDFVVLLSSMSAVLGGIGFTAYAAANAFQDRFVQTRCLPGGSAWRTACWDTWRESAAAGGGSLDKYSFAVPDALTVFDRLVRGGPRRAVVSAGDLDQRMAAWVPGGDPLRHTHSPAPQSSSDPTVDDYRRRLTKLWREALGTEHLGPHDDFFERGGNSLAGLQLVNAIQDEFRTVVPMIALLEAPTVAGMADRLLATERTSDR